MKQSNYTLPAASSLKLRPYQREAKRAIDKMTSNGHQGICLNMPSGAGKTEVAIALIRDVVEVGGSVLYVVDSEILLDQVAERLDRYGVLSVGFGQQWAPGMVQLTTAQNLNSLGRKEPERAIDAIFQANGGNPFDLAIIDPADTVHRVHHWISGIYSDKDPVGKAKIAARHPLGPKIRVTDPIIGCMGDVPIDGAKRNYREMMDHGFGPLAIQWVGLAASTHNFRLPIIYSRGVIPPGSATPKLIADGHLAKVETAMAPRVPDTAHATPRKRCPETESDDASAPPCQCPKPTFDDTAATNVALSSVSNVTTVFSKAMEHAAAIGVPFKQIVAFAGSMAQAEAALGAAKAHGLTAAVLDGKTDRPTRKGLLRAFAIEKLDVIVVVGGVLTSGISIPEARVAIMVRAIGSRKTAENLVGRAFGWVAPLAPGKDKALFFDPGGTVMHFGLKPEDFTPVNWTRRQSEAARELVRDTFTCEREYHRRKREIDKIKAEVMTLEEIKEAVADKRLTPEDIAFSFVARELGNTPIPEKFFGRFVGLPAPGDETVFWKGAHGRAKSVKAAVENCEADLVFVAGRGSKPHKVLEELLELPEEEALEKVGRWVAASGTGAKNVLRQAAADLRPHVRSAKIRNERLTALEMERGK